MFLYFFESAVLFSVLLFISFLVSTLEKTHEDETEESDKKCYFIWKSNFNTLQASIQVMYFKLGNI